MDQADATGDASSQKVIPVNTRISDHNGIRNEQVMTRSGRLWWIKDMYVYYQPTEWSSLSPSAEGE